MVHRGLLHLLLPLFLTPALFASGPTGTVTGTVTDPSGAVVPKARITVVNEATNAVRDAETNGDGDFTVALLQPGRYRVTAEAAGFRKSVLSDVTVDVDQTMRVDFSLEVGAATEEVRVKDTPPAIQTDTSTLGQVVNNRLVQQLPLNDRNFLSFALLVPGSQLPAEGSQNSTQGGALSVNGAREQSNNFLLDGVDNNDPYINQYVALPSVDAIQEFKVQSSDYSAEYGRASGAQINVVLRSGTNAFHGTLFEYFRNRNLDAKNYFDQPECTAGSVPGTCGKIPALQRNQFGGTLGGPVRRDQTFFFISYEGLRLRQATTRQATIPSQVQWATASALAALFGCPLNPSCQVGQNVFNLYPQANVGSDLVNSNTFLSAPVIRRSDNLYTAKLDQHFSATDTVSAHYSLIDQNIFSPFDPVNAFTALPGYGSFTLNHGQNAGLEWTRVFRSKLLNEFRLGFVRMRATVLQQNHGTDFNAALGFPDVLTNPVDLGYPNISLTGFDGIGEPVNYPQDRHDTTIEVADNVAWTVGRNQFKIGGDFHRLRLDNYLDFLARGEWLFLGCVATQSPTCTPPPGIDLPTLALSQLLAGVPDAAIGVSGTTNNSLRSHGVSTYVQDDIHVVPRFLLNVGMRYEYNTPPVEALNRFSVPDLSANSATCTPVPDCQFIQAGTNGIPKATYSPSKTDFGPRLGFAWRPLKTERWVVRSAYGIFWDSSIANINIFPRINPPYYNLSFAQQNPFTCPGGLCTVQDILNQPGGLVQDNMISPKFRDGYVQQWNADLQYEVLPNWMVDAAYVGSKGTRLSNVIDFNQTNPDTGPPFPQFASILYVESSANSSYNSLQLRSEKRTSKGLALLLSYTYSKSFDDISSVFGGSVGAGLPQNSQDLPADRGPSDFNAVNRFSGSFVYDLPVHRLWKGGPGRLLNNWQAGGIITAQSGSPFTVVLAGASTSAGAAFGNPARPDLVGSPFQTSSGPGCPSQVRTTQSWFNPCAFAFPAPGTIPNTFEFGNEGRNILTGPGFTNVDFGLSKSMALRSENHRVEFRGDFFNLFNHPNFDIPAHVLGATNFGQILSANSYGNKPPRQIQLSARYVF
ncbi:MAG TPA: carboxypeptidase-like regulatory domain-containing protein [Candidatus Dormibacteraeota bacterium]|nr:carboxypeptidase-like regulatory domain-containing protein [Candidatus Dormibacteraeota bacterium]